MTRSPAEGGGLGAANSAAMRCMEKCNEVRENMFYSDCHGYGASRRLHCSYRGVCASKFRPKSNTKQRFLCPTPQIINVRTRVYGVYILHLSFLLGCASRFPFILIIFRWFSHDLKAFTHLPLFKFLAGDKTPPKLIRNVFFHFYLWFTSKAKVH